VRENGIWRFRYNEALYAEYKDPHSVSYIKFSSTNCPSRPNAQKTLQVEFIGNRPVGGDTVLNGRKMYSRLTGVTDGN